MGCFKWKPVPSWYALAAGDRRYRRIPVEVAPGPDLARPLHPIWATIEFHAQALDGLCHQLAQVTFEVNEGDQGLLARLPVADTGDSLRIVLRRDEARFFLDQGGKLLAIEPQERQVDCAVFLILAELARQRAGAHELSSQHIDPQGSNEPAVKI